MMKMRQPNERCGNCVETSGKDFGGACPYAGEISSNFWCEHYERAKQIAANWNRNGEIEIKKPCYLALIHEVDGEETFERYAFLTTGEKIFIKSS
jgi:hypothetical protein